MATLSGDIVTQLSVLPGAITNMNATANTDFDTVITSGLTRYNSLQTTKMNEVSNGPHSKIAAARNTVDGFAQTLVTSIAQVQGDISQGGFEKKREASRSQNANAKSHGHGS